MPKTNDYDNYAKRRQKNITAGTMVTHRFAEKPMMKRLLPDIAGKTVLIIGCGTAFESIMLRELGAARIIGIDISEVSIQLAKESYPDCEFLVSDMHDIDLPDASIDIVYSSLAVHYSANREQLYQEIQRVLTPQGYFVFSVAHPIRWASEDTTIDGIPMKVIGFSEDPKNKRLYGKYLGTHEVVHHMPEKEILNFYVAPPSVYFRELQEAGFSVLNFDESSMEEGCKELDPYRFERYSRFPQFMGFCVKKD